MGRTGSEGGPEQHSVMVTRDAAAIMISVGDEMRKVLGWRPEELIGRPSTEFIHPEDQPSAIVAWFQMLEAPDEPHNWQGRYRTPQGEWRWVECINVYRLHDPENPVVATTMRTIAVDKVSLAEELRARKQLLSRLSDAMPIGMFEVGSDRSVTFTNDRLHLILGQPAAATFDAQFACIEIDDQQLLDSAFGAILREEAVDDVELRFVRSSEGNLVNRVCVLSMRPLTDDLGAVSGAVGCVADVTEQVLLRQQLEIRANVDELTMCLNRSAILKVISSALEHEQDRGGSIALVFVDLCRFKEANDVFGHAAGDTVLQVAGARLRNVVREGDYVGRFGGDEFLVVCPAVTSDTVALEIADRIRASLDGRVKVAAGTVELRASVGVAMSSTSSDADTLIAQADHAMYTAKHLGSVGVQFFSGVA